MRFLSFLFPKTIAKANSPINGEIKVVEQFGRRSIKAGGLEQSGPMIEKIWEKGIKTLPATRYPLPAPEILILGLGGGSAVKVINKYYPQAKILGIEIDPLMIKLGKRHLNLSEYKNLEIKVADAFDWLRDWLRKSDDLNHQTRFDLILIDLYLGRKTPFEMESKPFLKGIKQLLTKKGVVIFNRLRKKDECQFLDKLKRVYHYIKVIKPVANYLVICR